MTTLKVNEIFHSLQGESLYAGRACVLVRLTGCNLRCAYCDTPYAYDHGRDMALPEIINQVQSHECPLVEITGGEPLLQAHTPRLIRQLLDKKFTVLLETNGSVDISPVPEACIKIVDLKCPSSRESDKNDLKNIDRLAPHDQIKFVIATREDYAFACSLTPRITTIPSENILFSVADGQLDPSILAEWMLSDNRLNRFHIQLQIGRASCRERV